MEDKNVIGVVVRVKDRLYDYHMGGSRHSMSMDTVRMYEADEKREAVHRITRQLADYIAEQHAFSIKKQYDIHRDANAYRLEIAVMSVANYGQLTLKAKSYDSVVSARRLADAEVIRLRDVIKSLETKVKELDTVKAAFAILVPTTVGAQGPMGAPGRDGHSGSIRMSALY